MILKKIIAIYFQDRKKNNTSCRKMVYIYFFSKAGGKHKNHRIVGAIYNK